MSKAKDISEIISDANFGGTLDVAGKITADAGVDIDNINIDGTTIALSSGDLTIDVEGTIILDGDEAGATVHLKDGGTHWGSIYRSDSNFNIESEASDKDIVFKGNDGGSGITALTLDMSDAGTAVFNNKVGIGESAPGQVLVVRESSTPTIQIKDGAGSGTRVSGRLHIGEADSLGVSIENSTTSFNDNCAMVFKTSPAAGTITERMRIDSAGNVGIGTNTPTSGLEVSGKGVAVGSGCTASGTVGSMAVGHASSATGDHSFVFGREMTVSGDFAVGFALSDQNGLNLSANNTMAIVGGKVSVGTTSAGLGIMAVHGATGGNATFKAANTSSSGNTTCIMAFMDGSGSATSNSAFLQGFNGVTSYYLLGNGTHTFTSDENVKKNIETTRDGYLEDLAKLRVVKYNWKHEEDGTNKELGLIAQEVEEVFPNLVMEDIDPQIEEGQRRNKMIKVTVLPFMLLKAIQELSAKNDAQQTLIEAMEARITALEGRM